MPTFCISNSSSSTASCRRPRSPRPISRGFARARLIHHRMPKWRRALPVHPEGLRRETDAIDGDACKRCRRRPAPSLTTLSLHSGCGKRRPPPPAALGEAPCGTGEESDGRVPSFGRAPRYPAAGLLTSSPPSRVLSLLRSSSYEGVRARPARRPGRAREGVLASTARSSWGRRGRPC